MTEASGAQGWDHSCDILVFGSGAGGLFASLFASLRNLDVLLCEKTEQLGGTTATSGGIVWIPNNDQARQKGVSDSAELALTYLRHEIGGLIRNDLVEAFLASGPSALAELDAKTDVQFNVIDWPDYHPDVPGGLAWGRSLVAKPFDGRRLGSDFNLMRAPIHRLTVLGGMMVGADEIPHFLRPFGSWKSLRHVVARVLRHASDRLRYPRGTDVRNGNALVSRLFFSLRKRNVPIWLKAPLKELIREEGRVVGALVEHDGVPTRIRARRGVILATGGFPHNEEMRDALSKGFSHHHSLAFQGNVGDGIKAAEREGGVIDTALASPGLWTPASVMREGDGSETPVMYGYLDRGRAGIIAVDATARRFVNESNSYHDIVMAMHENAGGGEGHFYFITDQNFLRKNGLGAIRPPARNIGRYVRSGYIQRADTLDGLARQIGLDPKALAETVARHNGFAETGVDLDFGKGGNVYNRQFGEKHAGPNPNLIAIGQPPYYALRIYGATLGTTIGLKTDGNARVLDADGAPVPGLYACGNEMASAMRGRYPGGGVTIGPAMVFSYRAIEHVTGQSN